MCTSQGLLSGQKVSCLQCIGLNNRAGMIKGMVMQSLTAEILIDCGKFKYYGTFTYITQIIHSNTHLKPLKGNFSEKSLILRKLKTFNLRKFKFHGNLSAEGFELFSGLIWVSYYLFLNFIYISVDKSVFNILKVRSNSCIA